VKQPIASDLPILQSLGFMEPALLGYGGEANVYDIGDDCILRLLHAGASDAEFANRVKLSRRITDTSCKLPFRTPKVLKTIEIDGRLGTIEKRFPGVPLTDVFASTQGAGAA